jgi:hypothetical protein
LIVEAFAGAEACAGVFGGSVAFSAELSDADQASPVAKKYAAEATLGRAYPQLVFSAKKRLP